MLRTFARRLAHFLRRDQFAEELREEIELHVELRARQMEERAAALRRFGNRGAVMDASSAAWGWTSWQRLGQDFRLAFRTLRKTPKFTVFAVGTLALGLGMNTAVFSVVNAVMLRSLPYPEAERLVSLWETETPRAWLNSSSSGAQFGPSGHVSVSVPDFLDYSRQVRAFESVAAFSLAPKNLTGVGNPERILGESVSWNFSSVLRVVPVLGRSFLPEDDQYGAPLVVILTHEFWRRYLGEDGDVLARSIILDGQPYRVVGVLPAGFQSPRQLTTRERVEFYVPAAYAPAVLADRSDHFVSVVARLGTGASISGAQAELDGVSAYLASRYPVTNDGYKAGVGSLRKEITLAAGDPLMALFGASGLIILITCVNVANLFLVRAIARRHETSVRFALGASRFRVARQFLAESLVVAAAGCAMGILLGIVMLRVLVSMAPQNIPRIDTAVVDWRVFLVEAVVATLAGVVFGVFPALSASQAGAGEAIRTAARTAGGKRQTRWRGVLTAAELALSLVLLVGAGLLLKSFVVLMGVDLGFRPERVVAMNINLPVTRYANATERLRFFERLTQRVEALPGVVSAAYANRMPMRGSWNGAINVDTAPDVAHGADFQAVSPRYFEALGIRLVRGRLLTADDRAGQPATAVVNQEFARRFLAGTEAVGHRIRYKSNPSWTFVVGVVSDIRRAGKEGDVTPQVYFPAAQTQAYPTQLADFAVRSEGDPLQLVRAIQAQVWTIDQDQPVTRVRTLEEIITASVAERRFQTVLLLVFAGVAVGLAVMGVFGVLSFSVSQRISELGIRIALGARPRSIVWLVVRQAGSMITAGLALGLAGAWVLSRFVASMLFQVRPNDWPTYVLALLVLAVVAVAAALVPARSGSKVDPIVALRWE